MRPLLVDHLDSHPECLRDYENVTEDDGGVNLRVAVDGLKRQI